MTEVAPRACSFDVAAVSDPGTTRAENEDACGHLVAGATSVLVAVADGVSGGPGGATASSKAIEVVLRAYQELSAALPAPKRLYRAVQQANIEVYDLGVVVPELRGMATTLTAILLDQGQLVAAHVGDSRLYRVRAGRATQLTKDHTVAAERARARLVSEERARVHPDRSVLTRSLGRELVASIDRLEAALEEDDVLVLCSDGLYNVVGEDELARLAGDGDADTAARALVAAANARGTPDNVTAAVVRVTGAVARSAAPPAGLMGRLRRLFGPGASMLLRAGAFA
jgi:serine/threonine protein phosphatase PrpC